MRKVYLAVATVCCLCLPSYGGWRYNHLEASRVQEHWITYAKTGEVFWQSDAGIRVLAVLPHADGDKRGHLIRLAVADEPWPYEYFVVGTITIRLRGINFQMEVADRNTIKVNRQIDQTEYY